MTGPGAVRDLPRRPTAGFSVAAGDAVIPRAFIAGGAMCVGRAVDARTGMCRSDAFFSRSAGAYDAGVEAFIIGAFLG